MTQTPVDPAPDDDPTIPDLPPLEFDPTAHEDDTDEVTP